MKNKDIEAGKLYVVAPGAHSFMTSIMRAVEPVNRSYRDRVTYEYVSKPYGWRMRNAVNNTHDVPSKGILASFETWTELHPKEAKLFKLAWLQEQWKERNRNVVFALVNDVFKPKFKDKGIEVGMDYRWGRIGVMIAGDVSKMVKEFPQLAEDSGMLPLIEPEPTGEEELA